MAKDLFGGLGGLMKGLSGFMPQDDPNVKLMNAQTELNDLKQQESELFVEIGRQAYAQNPSAYAQMDKLKLLQSNIASAESKLQATQQEKQAAEQAAKEADAKGRCPNCGESNPDGIKFCQQCGAKMGAVICPQCGAQLVPGTRFCGECGSQAG